MSRHLGFFARIGVVVLTLSTLSSICHAQTGFGVDGNGNLFNFDITVPGSIPITSIGNVGFTPEGIDFKPDTNELYAIDVTAATTQLYKININTGAATPTSSSFPSVGADYTLTTGQHYGFDFNPTTNDGSGNYLIRFLGTNGDSLRIKSLDGTLASSDTDLLIQPGSNSPFVDAAAYINNVAAPASTVLYDMDIRNNSLYTQSPPNAGTLTLVGPFGASVAASVGIGFDVYTVPGDVDPTIGGDSAYAVLKRPATNNGAYLLYQVDLATGNISNGKLVGPVGSPSDFTGGFSIAPLPVPEPATIAMLAISLVACTTKRRRTS